MTKATGSDGSRGSRSAPYRVRRPKDKVDLMEELTTGSKAFASYRDLLGFAAALGWSLGKPEPFEQTAEPVAWEVFTNHPGNEALVDMLTAVQVDDADALSSERLIERIQRFEEYANAGLIALAQMSAADSTLDALTRLIIDTEVREQAGDLDALITELSGL